MRSYQVGPLGENTYLILNGRDGLLIDPGFSSRREYAVFKDDLLGFQADLKAVLFTHAHIDHVAGLPFVRRDWPDIPLYLSGRNRVLWNTAHLQAELFGFSLGPMAEEPLAYPADGMLRAAGLEIEVRDTPGHSPDHVSLVAHPIRTVFAGDVIFRRSVGRTDIYLADASELECSIREQIYTLPDHYRIAPGHGVETTVGEERRENPFVRG